ncbi:MAG: amidohydrolase family protein [Bryobacterales bacterium]|nr:amidohydrolase family protein [Bryobacterales bacterium]
MRFGISLLLAAGLLPAETYDLVIANGRVMDPASGLDAIRYVAISAGKIAAISDKSLAGKRVIDAKGLVVSPGFIDMHQHGQTEENYWLKARDGVTTALELEIGVEPVAKWYAERQGKAVVNYGASVSHVIARMGVMKDTGAWLPKDNAIKKVATAEERKAIRDRLDRGLAEGALGIGFGFGYTPAAGVEELLAMFEVAAKYKRPAYIHMRYGSLGEPGLPASLHEVFGYAAMTGAPLHIVHIGASSTTRFDVAMDLIARAKKHGIDVSMESYPYVAGMTRIETSIFDEGFQERLGLPYNKMLWVNTGEWLNEETFRKYRKQGGYVATFTNTEEMIRKNMAHPEIIVASDGILENGKGHPRVSGTYARVLGKYVREEKALPLMLALKKMTTMPAERLHLSNKGRLQVGKDADVTVFNPATVIDKSTFSNAALPSEGIPFVVVNGVVVVDNGKLVDGAKPGRAVTAQ